MIHLFSKRYAEAETMLRDVSIVLFWFGLLMLVPMVVGIIYGEPTWPMYLAFVAAICAPSLIIKRYLKRPQEPFERLTLVTIALVWIICCLVAAIPFLFLGGMNPLDAIFESVSSISTAGFSVMANVETASASLILWRSMIAWLGGVGITAVAFYGVLKSKTVSKLVLGEGYERLKPSLANTGREILKIYGFWTIVGAIVLCLIGVSVFDSINLSMNALSSTGMVNHSNSLAYYMSMPNFDIVVGVLTLLMIIGAISFVVHYRVFKDRSFRAYLESTETKAFFAIIILFTIIIAGVLYSQGQANRVFDMSFEAISSSTTTGFELDRNVPLFAGIGDFVKGMLIILAIIGGSQNCSAGGVKVKRFVILLKVVWWRVKRNTLPADAVVPLRYEGKPINQEQVSSVATFIFIYAASLIIATAILVAFSMPTIDSMMVVTQAQACAGVSPIAPTTFAGPVKVVLIFVMLFGRLEFWPLFALGAYVLRR